jgi:hypothetical protein
VTHHVTTQDNPWSTADHAYTIDCKACSLDYRFDHDHLVRRSSEVAYHGCREAEHRCHDDLQRIIEPLIEGYFIEFEAKTKKAEHAEIVRLNLSANSYQGYLADRAKGKSLASTCWGLRNTSWLRNQAERRGVRENFEAALSALNAAKNATQIAARQIERIKVCRR